MSLVSSASPVASSLHISLFTVHNVKSHTYTSSNPSSVVAQCNYSRVIADHVCKIFGKNSLSILKVSARDSVKPNKQLASEGSTMSLDWEDDEDEDSEDMESPWEGAIIYKRNPSVSHVEYCTTLERLGLWELSTENSKTKASMMGLRVTKAVKDYPDGTPVQVSIDVTRNKEKTRLDGIIRTVITLDCNRCGEPAVESLFNNFSILLTEEPFEEPEFNDMGVYSEDDDFEPFTGSIEEELEDDDDAIDPDDWMYFPPGEEEIDISKHIRDIVHLEVTIDAICDPSCKGACLECGTNLNFSSCNCGKEKVDLKGYGPFANLRKQM